MDVAPTNPTPDHVSPVFVLKDSQVHDGGIVANNVQISQIFHSPAPPAPSTDVSNIAKISDWLKLKVNFHAIHNDVKKKRTEATGDWFINSSKYQEWRAGKGTVLCGTGIPGAGKTTLMSRVIDDLLHLEKSNDSKICVLFVYHRYDDLLSTTEILKSLVLHASEKQNQQFLDAVKSIQSRCELQKTDPTEDDLIGLLQLLETIFDRVFYVFDGADELVQPHVQSDTLVGFIKVINRLQGNIIIASRPLELLQTIKGVIRVELMAQNDDMRTLIDDKIDCFPNLKEVLEETGRRKEIVDGIIDKANGMFLHAALQVKALTSCHTPTDVQEELASFPEDLTDMYKKTFHRIKAQDPRSARIATMTLAWLVHAKAPLSVEALRTALAAHPETHSVEPSRMPPLKSILSVCCGLVEHHPETDIVRLVHFTARDALEPLLLEELPQPHAVIIKVLLQLMVDNGIPNWLQGKDELKELLQRPLLRYAYQHWADYARECSKLAGAREDVARFLCQCALFPYTDLDRLWFDMDILQPLHVAAMYDIPWFIKDVFDGHYNPLLHNQANRYPAFDGWDVNARSRDGDTALHLAGHNGHGTCVNILLQFPAAIDVNARDDRGRTALMQAAIGRHQDVVQRLLVEPGIDVHAVDREGRTVLMEAAARGFKDVVERLLAEPGIAVNAVDAEGRTALMEAAVHGRKDVVERLLAEPGIDANAVDEQGRTALMDASLYGDVYVVERLLAEPGIDVNAVDAEGRTALMKAAARGFKDVVERLLAEPGIAVNAVDAEGRTALMHASLYGDVYVVERLLAEPGIDVHAVDVEGRTALMWAACWVGYKDVVERLLAEPGIDVNAVDAEGRTALMWAAVHGRKDVVERLLAEPGIDVHAVDREGRTVLMEAAARGFKDVVERLLAEPGIAVNAVDAEGRTALMEAAAPGHTDVVERFLAAPGINVNAVDEQGSTALMWAVAGGHNDIVERLLAEPGIDVHAVDVEGRTALMWAACWVGNKDVVERLLAEPGIDVNAVDAEGRTALMWAVAGGHKDIVERLIAEPGIDVNTVDREGRTALMEAAAQGPKDIVERFLAAPGINVNAVDEQGSMALMEAAAGGHKDIVERLLEEPGIDLNTVDAEGRTALMWAAAQGHKDIVERLLAEPGIDVNTVDRQGRTALMEAAKGGHKDIVERLLAEPGIDVNTVDREGRTALNLVQQEAIQAKEIGGQLVSGESDALTALSDDSSTEKVIIDYAGPSNKDPEAQQDVMVIDNSCRSETSPIHEAAIQAADRPTSTRS
ncbi:ankyrin repeat domain-containing protein 50 [Coprinopsis cinerea okayama7|uniref:Ankyrin repeat domain-containing protein 50 n=1 Tax=Coprinopsis cinerea (strain Okayama-7 / 130 / ATCC MYA-4618 / FGSC 9003) TaxID=240176 RepID=A8PBI4_COPC7|nr:ankyrin repeat domain-containing protein 50 [Coprinopsis cinerea okayama7\|eukprot:XP_001840191.2 ankyrin repeat domain-containing protein 50 [Coprinopsis cinerea okayama7\